MASSNLHIVVVTTLVVVASMHFSTTTAATSYLVGGANGWHLPSNPHHYEEWAKGKKFVKGDQFFFIYKKEEHNVAYVKRKEDFDKCNITAVDYVYKSGGVPSWIFNEVEIVYFICTIHCAKGQKVVIDVKAS
ncbi:hypothetical protein QVD17_29666 [Tagetes erecta]|uniref:Phytocyanin domain-containing protein n=1 Tax=Tagetes erecta TaxID=13708 RepID=A0AAD8NLH7_TARER|nr:hypothetical protein QVD17_29666 [Tagetes erecta]